MSNKGDAPDITASSTVPSGKTIQPELRRYLLWLVVIIGMAQAMGQFLPDLLRADLFLDDARQHVWWTYRFADPELFPNDFTADFFSRPLFAPYGFQAIYGLLTRWLDAQVVSELIPFVLAIPVTVLAWLIGRRVAGGSLAGGFVAAVFAASQMFYLVRGGFPRSFAIPILMLGLWALLARRNGWLGLSFLLAAVLYPQSGINLGLLTAVVLGVRTWRERRLPADWPWLVAPGLVALLLVGSVYARKMPEGVGPKVTAAQARTMPEFGPDGRNAFFNDDPVAFYIEGVRSGLGLKRYRFLAIAVVLVAAAMRFRGAISFEAWALVGTSLMAFALAHATLFTLHLPNRFVYYSGNIFFMMCLAGLLPCAWAALQQWSLWKQFATPLNRPGVRTGIAVLVAAGFVIGSILQCHARLSRPVAGDCEAAYAFLESLPRDILVAAHPWDASSIPLRSRRSVLVSSETALPYYLGYYRKASERMAAELAAFFAPDWAGVETLNKQYGVDVFFVNLKRYGDSKRNVFFAPFREDILKAVARGRNEGFVLEHPPAERVLFAQGDYLVVSLKPKN